MRGLLYELYRQSGLAFSYRRYLATLTAAPAGAAAAAGAAGLLLLGPAAGAAFAAIAGLLAFAGLLLYPVHLVSARRSHFENNFVYTLSVLLPLLAAGVPLGRAVTRLAEVEDDRYIARELALAAREMVVMGSSPEEALRNSAARVPSPTYRETVEVLTKAARITQRVDLVLLARLDWMLRAKQVRAQSLVRSLSLMFEVFVVAVMLLPIMVYIVALSFSPLGALQVGGLALDPLTLMVLIGLVYTPVMGVVFYLIFDSITKI
ncbi:type II secretion system protein [Pyrobaculum islandicum DSM 4184]|uniref:Type II secretion system protein n=1 Tax=Pyrobaculum islandicum (strain DSM 4184 / JCM 9189 / GEO3) TaxID=384616 RepID=A1RUC9_PYRIL|nr:type II secretion system F family protein [Pyrobaculum islandicum]ABL88561.1 type II secretion system protein [Pyrobaculum islandicum DSM 4184]